MVPKALLVFVFLESLMAAVPGNRPCAQPAEFRQDCFLPIPLRQRMRGMGGGSWGSGNRGFASLVANSPLTTFVSGRWITKSSQEAIPCNHNKAATMLRLYHAMCHSISRFPIKNNNTSTHAGIKIIIRQCTFLGAHLN